MRSREREKGAGGRKGRGKKEGGKKGEKAVDIRRRGRKP